MHVYTCTLYDSFAFSNHPPFNSISFSLKTYFSFPMGETQEVQHPHETSFTIHMGESQEVQLSKIGKSTFSLP